MNSLNGHITEIQTNSNLSIVAVQVTDGPRLKAVIIETPETANYLKAGGEITAIFKETEVIIGTGDLSGVSLQNRIPGEIKQLEMGQLLAKLTIEFAPEQQIVSIISVNAVKQLSLQEGSQVTAMIKLNEMMLREI